MDFNLENITRENIKKLIPYSSARSEYKGKPGIFLDANENGFGGSEMNVNRYPDPYQFDLKQKISVIKDLAIENIFIGNGSDEAIDILFRAFCEPGKDHVIICPPTYGMYEVSANINNVIIKRVNLIPETFQLDTDAILNAIDQHTKLIFVCCPNNPTGNGMKWNDIKRILENFKGILVLDEAYIHFAAYRSLVPELLNYPNLVILQTLSKAWGLAGLRLGMAFASRQIIEIFNKVKPPYNINIASQKIATLALSNIKEINTQIKTIISERKRIAEKLAAFTFVKKVFPSEANFLLVRVNDPLRLYSYLVQQNIIVRDRSKAELCEGCLRITIGTQKENKKLLQSLKTYES
jgi:histidinol-phosphate aminotransferase